MTDQQRHIDAATHAIAAHLRDRLMPGLSPELVAGHIVAALTADHWRCIPPARAVINRRDGDPGRAARGATYARKLMGWADNADVEEDEEALQCPLCPHQVWVSPEDGDAALSEMHRHFRAEHRGQDPDALLARTTLTREDQQ